MGQRLDNAHAIYLEGIRDGNYVEAINKYSAPPYTQHSTPVKDGRDGFIEFFADFIERNPIRDIKIIRSFEDGQYVFLQALQDLNNGEFQYVTADIFDTDDDAKLIEHWDMIAEVRGRNPSGRTQIDGPTKVADLDKTEENKRLVTSFVSEVLQAGDFDRMAEFVGDEYAQHSPDVADGVPAFQAYAGGAGLRYVEVHNVIGSGNFVAVLAEAESRGTRHAVIDLFRVENDKLVEHWDVTEEITPEGTWVNTGKF